MKPVYIFSSVFKNLSLSLFSVDRFPRPAKEDLLVEKGIVDGSLDVDEGVAFDWVLQNAKLIKTHKK
jgi:hypothetical protein